MHHLYFTLVPEDNASDSEEARNIAEEILIDNNFTANSNPYFGSPKGDWFKIGGRWSGILNDYKNKNKKNCNNDLSYEGDAKQITDKLKPVLEKWKDVEVFDEEEFEEITVVDLLKNFDKYKGDWIVVVDYHN